MKIKILLIFTGLLSFTACNDLDLNPLSEGSSENWYSDEKEISMALNDLYQEYAWQKDALSWTDDYTYRTGTTPMTDGTLNGEDGTVAGRWKDYYTAIARANTILMNLENSEADITQQTLDRFVAEARFVRAAQYAGLITHYGDVVFYTNVLDIEEAFTKGTTPKSTILEAIYEDYDFAASHLPLNYGTSEYGRATKGAALALKARIALYMEDWAIARDAAKAVMDLNVYTLHPNFSELFLSSTKKSPEAVFVLPRSVELGVYLGNNPVRYTISRNAGGYASRDPSWDLLFSFLCTDGLPIHQSPLFDPKDPFKNRDPRCTATIVEFDTPHLGIMYSVHPDSLTSYNFNTGKSQTNNDNRVNNQYGSYNGLIWKKGVDEDWLDRMADPDNIIVRYADVLLMYAEAKIELDEIDQSVLDAINKVRARAYGVEVGATSEYPAVTATNQALLRKILRTERRMELAWEGLRYRDIMRWKLAEKVLNYDSYGMLNPAELKEKIVDGGLWFFPETPEIDDDDWVPNFEPIYEKGLIRLLSVREFDPSKNYLWPLPTKEILINKNLQQNTGY